MGAVRALAAALLLAAVSPAGAQDRSDPLARWAPLIAEASARFGIPESWIERVIRAESGGRTSLDGRPITSPAGAMGLMQLMPGTWADMRARLGLGSDPHDPRDNILAGTAYLKLMYQRFGYPGLFGAYNAGPGRYAVHLADARPLPAETQGYLVSVGGAAPNTGAPTIAATPKSSLFAIKRRSSAADGPPLRRVPEGLFAIRSER